jgi:hypothetical protein
MNINQLNPEIVDAINLAKAMVSDITGRKPADINVALEHGYDNALRWSVNVFEDGYHSIRASGSDLSKVVEDIRKEHADHLTGVGSSVEQVKRLADKLGVKVEVLA